MQRRAAAAYVAFFLVLAIGSYGVIATAESPDVGFSQSNADYVVQEGEEITVGERTYTVQSVEKEESEGGGHGGGGGASVIGTMTWTNDSSQYTETWEQNQTVTLDGTDYQVVIPNESDPTRITLRNEDVPEGARIVERDGTRYVVNDTDGDGDYQDEGGTPVDEYAGFERRTIEQGSTFDYDGNATAVGNITSESVPLSWTAPRTNEVEVTAGGDIQFQDDTYAAYAPNENTILLAQEGSTGYEQYHESTETLSVFNERMSGFWGITILSGLAAAFMVMFAYLPTKD